MKFSWTLAYLIFYLYRCFASVISESVISRITTLGDNQTYLKSKYLADAYIDAVNTGLITGRQAVGYSVEGFLLQPRRMATEFIVDLSSIFYKIFLGNPYLINIAFQTIAFFGIIALLKELEPRLRLIMLLFLALPSFTIWSSIAGKEALVVFAVGFVLAYLVRITKRFSLPRLMELFAGLVLLVFKAQYFPAVLFIFGAVIAGKVVKQKTFVVFLVGLMSIFSLYIMRDKVEALASKIPRNFVSAGGELVNAGPDGLAGGRSTRPIFWTEPYDIFWKSPEGMIVSLIGPRPKEAFEGKNPILLFGFFEGLFIFLLLLGFLSVRARKSHAFLLIAVIFSLFWILFATYPLSIMNPGTSIRYRTGYLPIIALLTTFFLSHYTFNIFYKKKSLSSTSEKDNT